MSVLEQYVDAGMHPAPPRSLSVVSASNLIKRYGQGDAHVGALRGVSLEIEEHRMTAVMGPSGSGKSTLMHILGCGTATPSRTSSTACVQFVRTALPGERGDHAGMHERREPEVSDRA